MFAETHSRNFLTKYKPLGRVWVEDEFWFAEVRRKFTDASNLLKDTLSGSEKELKANGIASYLAREVAKSHRIMKKRDLLAFARKNKGFGQYLQDFLEKNTAL